jgi:hypothetical protein
MEEVTPIAPIVYDYETLERKEKTTKKYKMYHYVLGREVVLDSDYRVWDYHSKPEVPFLVAKIAQLEEQIVQLKNK